MNFRSKNNNLQKQKHTETNRKEQNIQMKKTKNSSRRIETTNEANETKSKGKFAQPTSFALSFVGRLVGRTNYRGRGAPGRLGVIFSTLPQRWTSWVHINKKKVIFSAQQVKNNLSLQSTVH